MTTSCYVPGCENVRTYEDCCAPHSLTTYKEVCGHLILKDPARPCVRTKGHAAETAHRDMRQYHMQQSHERRRLGYATDRHAETAIPNDGVIDWTAIDLTIEGVRPVRLTWVEREIAAAILLARGEEKADVERQVGVAVYKDDARSGRINKMADYIREHGYDACH